MMDEYRIPQEGDLFQIIIVENHRFELRYGYYEESDRLKCDPVPIYPDLKIHPLYTSDGQPIVTAIQKPCEHYLPSEGYEKEDCCSSCIHYPNMREEIGICQCKRQHLPLLQGGDV